MEMGRQGREFNSRHMNFFFSIFCVRPGTLNPPHYPFPFGAISLSLFFSAFFSCAISSFLLYLLFCFVLRGILDVTVCFVLQTYKQLRCTFGASHVYVFSNIAKNPANEQIATSVWCKGVCLYDGRVFVWPAKGFFFSFFMCVVFFVYFSSLLFSSRTNDPSVCLIENTCIRFSPSAVSIPFDLRHPWEACADLPQGDLVLSYKYASTRRTSLRARSSFLLQR